MTKNFQGILLAPTTQEMALFQAEIG